MSSMPETPPQTPSRQPDNIDAAINQAMESSAVPENPLARGEQQLIDQERDLQEYEEIRNHMATLVTKFDELTNKQTLSPLSADSVERRVLQTELQELNNELTMNYNESKAILDRMNKRTLELKRSLSEASGESPTPGNSQQQ